MTKIIGIELKENGKIYYFNSNNLKLVKNIYVIVETEKGIQYGKVVTEEKELEEENSNKGLQVVCRIATKDDSIQFEKNKKDALQAMEKAIKIAEKLKLEMKFIETVYTFDRNQLMFYFVSDNRVDFRDLAKELASIYKTRIELRQIGVRDKAKEVSGIGMCGRKLCCSCFLNDLDSVSISMAKNQNLALNPSKINGLCGRLLCCLNYEDELYSENKEDMPEVGNYVKTELGDGMVTFIDIPNRKYIVNVKDYGKVEVKLASKCDRCGKSNK